MDDRGRPMAWSFLFDIVHHRGQTTTYLRPMGSTVLQTYGLSADEPVTRPRPERADRLQAIEIVSSMSDGSTAVTSCTTSGSSVRICPVPNS